MFVWRPWMPNLSSPSSPILLANNCLIRSSRQLAWERFGSSDYNTLTPRDTRRGWSWTRRSCLKMSRRKTLCSLSFEPSSSLKMFLRKSFKTLLSWVIHCLFLSRKARLSKTFIFLERDFLLPSSLVFFASWRRLFIPSTENSWQSSSRRSLREKWDQTLFTLVLNQKQIHLQQRNKSWEREWMSCRLQFLLWFIPFNSVSWCC